jgi:hypothetical protein
MVPRLNIHGLSGFGFGRYSHGLDVWGYNPKGALAAYAGESLGIGYEGKFDPDHSGCYASEGAWRWDLDRESRTRMECGVCLTAGHPEGWTTCDGRGVDWSRGPRPRVGREGRSESANERSGGRIGIF